MTIHFVQQGKSKIPLVLLHAFPVTHSMWRHQLDALSNEIGVIAPDLPGFGSSPTLREETGLDAYTHSVLRLLDEQGVDKAIFGGCSMGGYILFELWRQARERCAGMILCNTRAEADTEATKQGRMDTIESIRSNGLDSLAESMVGKVFGKTTLVEKKDLVKSTQAVILENSPVGVIRALQAMAKRVDSTEDLPGIRIPVLVVVGEEDKVTPPSAAERMVDALPNAQLIVIPKAGHLSPMEQPDAVNRAVRGYVEKIV